MDQDWVLLLFQDNRFLCFVLTLVSLSVVLESSAFWLRAFHEFVFDASCVHDGHQCSGLGVLDVAVDFQTLGHFLDRCSA